MNTPPDNKISNPHDAMQILRDLDTGIMNHLAWLKKLHRALICNETPSEADLSADAHCQCKFGRWYYQGGNHPELRASPIFQVIGDLHKSMHDAARGLLQKQSAGRAITYDEYDAFMDQAISFKWKVRCLQFEIVKSICVVDHLTGAWNRQSMLAKLAEEMERMNRNGLSSCICMMDIDHFKQVNDGYGHPAGDQVLQAAVHFVSEQLRKYDSIFRYGGEEFLICMPNISLQAATLTLDRLRAKLEQLSIPLADGQSLSITASFGVAEMKTAISIQDTIHMADHALLCAKSKGRNQVCMWEIEE